jgi:hypothetical protein
LAAVATANEVRWKLWAKQRQCFLSDAREILFGGASSGGKSHLVRVALCAWCLDIEHLQCVLIRKKYADIIANHVEGATGFRALLKPWIEAGQVSITKEHILFHSTQSRIEFVHCQDERQFDSAQGVERDVIVVDEATQIGERLIRFFRGWCRMTPARQEALPEQWRGKFPRILYTANPIGPSVGFFRRAFIKARAPYEIELVHGFTRQYIPSKAEDNKATDLEAFRGRMEGIGDSAVAHALIEGDWESPTGDYFPEWDEDRHVLADFVPPEHWFRFRTFDWGTRDPAVCYWWAVSPGEQINGKWLPRGALIGYREWYICADDDQSQGRRLRNEDMRQGILDRTEDEFRHQVTLTDSLPFQDRGGETIAQVFNNQGNGVTLTEADTSRVPGWSQLRARLIGIQPDTNSAFRYPMLYVTEQCRAARDYLPALTRHPNENKREDAQEHGEATHACDAIRYACLAHRVIRDAPEPPAKIISRTLEEFGKRKNLRQMIPGLPL